MSPELEMAPPPAFRSSERLARFSLLMFAAGLLAGALSMMVEEPLLGLLSDFLQWGAFLIGLIFLMRFSKLRQSPWRFVFIALGFVLMLGVLAKLQHWGIASLFLVCAYGGMAAGYLIWTFRKPQRLLLDYLKLMWALFFAVAAFVRLQHWGVRGLDFLALLVPYIFQILVWLQWRLIRKRVYNARFTS